MTDAVDLVEMGSLHDFDGPKPAGPSCAAISKYELGSRSGLKLFGVIALAMAILCIRNHAVFSVPIREQGDEAANSILVNQAVHFQLLVGNYSREGFNHPGPAFLYILSFGQEVFYSFLHAVPAPFNGQLIAVFLLNCAILALTARVIARHTQSWSIAVLAVAVIVLMTGGTLSWTSAWMPYIYAAPFLLVTLSGVSVALGAFQDLPIFTFAVVLLVHGHVAFIGITGIYVVLVAMAWLLLHRPWHSYAAQLRSAKKLFLASAVIVFLFAVPIAVNLILHWPGQFGLYWHYLHSNSNENEHSLRQVVSYVKGFWPGGSVGIALVMLAGLGGTALAVTDSNRTRRLFVFGVLVSVIVMTLEVALYAYKGVDLLNLAYTGYFYYSIPAAIVTTVLMEALGRLSDLRGSRTARRGMQRASLAAFILCAGVGLAVFATQTSTLNTYWGEPSLPRIAAAIHDSPLRDGRGVALSLGNDGAVVADWPDAVGILIAASREDYQPCIANAAWQFVVTSQYICSPAEARDRWRIAVEQTNTPVPRDDPLVFRMRRSRCTRCHRRSSCTISLSGARSSIVLVGQEGKVNP